MSTPQTLLIFALLLSLLSGCQSGSAWDWGLPAAGMGAGAVAGHAISDDPWVVAGGTALGGLAGMGLNEVRAEGERNEFAAGYERGLSDSVKRQYWIQVNLQKMAHDRDQGKTPSQR